MSVATRQDNILGDDGLHWGDFVVIGIYFCSVMAVGIWSSRRGKHDSVSGYFLASRNMHFLPVGASLWASNIDSTHFIGLAGSAAASGIAVAMFELHAMFTLIILGWVFIPVYLASCVFTMPEYLRKRFGGQRIRIFLSCLSLVLYVFTKISADLFAGAIFIEQSLKWNFYFSVMVLLVVAATFTIIGGLTAVIWTDFIQMILLLCGGIVLMGRSLYEVGGYSKLIEQYQWAYPGSPNSPYTNVTITDANSTKCGLPLPDAMHLFRDATPGASEFPWTGFLFGLPVTAIWYWCTDQVIVQRLLASKNYTHAKAGCVMAAFCKITPLFLLVFVGMASRILFPDKVACNTPELCMAACNNKNGCTNIAYPLLVIELMPPGLRGLMLATMMAALMSSLTSIFNSSSTLFTLDIWRRIRKQASEVELVLVGRTFVVCLVAVAIIWMPIIQNFPGSQLFIYTVNIMSFLSPPVMAIYMMAIFVPRVNEQGAFFGLLCGMAVGITRFVLQFGWQAPPCGEEDQRPYVIQQLVGKVHYLHFAAMSFAITSSLAILISLLSKPIPRHCLHRLTFWYRYDTEPRVDIESKKNVKKIATSQAPLKYSEEAGLNTVSGSVEQFHVKEGGPTSPVSPAQWSSPGLTLPTKTSKWRRWFYFICGVSDEAIVTMTRERYVPEVERTDLLVEDNKWRRIANLGESYSLPSKMPRESSILIAENAKHVKISSAALHKLSRSIAEKTDVVRTSYLDYDVHAKPTDVHAVDWIFATSALNFCFWPQEPGAPKFTVDLNGTKHTGYFALCAAFVRAQQQGKPIHDPKFYGSLTLKEMEEIFYSSTSSPIPLLSKRLEILKETAEILIQEFHGTAEELVRRAEKSSVDLYRLVVERFPSFRDEAEFQGHRVSFYKRAQIFVADLWACFEGKGIGEFHDIEWKSVAVPSVQWILSERRWKNFQREMGRFP
ncbi:unnamed protein product [Cyprideis torosa]|uniref:Queuosine salvage protein n=1 Tax=Cyprideis torosa TaxID=163714 RepID=A0A7R8WAT7_9CRUS|nr:unnamed protein product [Cyprideis torosa]CAG0886193.1 unnamed protein product [Cyprideis torosa]